MLWSKKACKLQPTFIILLLPLPQFRHIPIKHTRIPKHNFSNSTFFVQIHAFRVKVIYRELISKICDKIQQLDNNFFDIFFAKRLNLRRFNNFVKSLKFSYIFICKIELNLLITSLLSTNSLRSLNLYQMLHNLPITLTNISTSDF